MAVSFNECLYWTLVEKRPENETRPERARIPTETFNHVGALLRHHPRRFGNDQQDEARKEYDDPESAWHAAILHDG